jgi:hypothetical protein
VAAARSTLRDGDEETRKRARDLLKRAGNGGIQSAAHDGQVEVVTGPPRRRHRGGCAGQAPAHRAALGGPGRQARRREAAPGQGREHALADEDKNQPLHLAALAGSAEVTRLLLAKKADPNLANRREFTRCIWPRAKAPSRWWSCLLAAGANPRAKGRAGRPPMHIGRRGGTTRRRPLFLAKGLDINLPDEKTQGPIFYAAGGGHTELVKMLLDRKAAIRGTGMMADVAGTPLHDAARGGHVATMELLIARGVPLTATEFGRTALQVAANEARSRP